MPTTIIFECPKCSKAVIKKFSDAPTKYPSSMLYDDFGWRKVHAKGGGEFYICETCFANRESIRKENDERLLAFLP